MKELTEFIELSELEMQQVRGGGTLPELKNDELGSYYEWPDGTWVAVDGLA